MTIGDSGAQGRPQWIDNAVLGVLALLVLITGYAAFATDQPGWTAAAMATCLAAGAQLGRRLG